MREPVWVVYDCGHTLMFTPPPPLLGDMVFCIKCFKEVIVVDAPDEYRIRCQNCTYGKAFGVAKLSAGIAAAKHANKRGHIVRVYNGSSLDRTIGSGQPRLVVTDANAAPPF